MRRSTLAFVFRTAKSFELRAKSQEPRAKNLPTSRFEPTRLQCLTMKLLLGRNKIRSGFPVWLRRTAASAVIILIVVVGLAVLNNNVSIARPSRSQFVESLDQTLARSTDPGRRRGAEPCRRYRPGRGPRRGGLRPAARHGQADVGGGQGPGAPSPDQPLRDLPAPGLPGRQGPFHPLHPALLSPGAVEIGRGLWDRRRP